MGDGITTSHGLTIGLDLGDTYTSGAVLSESGEVVETFRVATTSGGDLTRWAFSWKALQTDQQQLRSVEPGCRLATYWEAGSGSVSAVAGR